jgi:hypothetical protein
MTMSREVLEIVEKMDKKELKTQLALQCAPLLTGIKLSNLLTVARDRLEDVEAIFRNTDITVHTLYQTENRITLLLFREKELLAYLNRKEVKETMHLFGYQTIRLIDIFENLCARYQKYMSDHQSFPHELGLLLGYPVDDVLGFTENEGRNYLYSGYWKVYGDVAKARKTFDSYNAAREEAIRLVSAGMEITELVMYAKVLQSA